MNRRLSPALAGTLLATAAWVFAGPVLAHPHGTMQCGLSVDFQHGRPQTVAGRLLMDQQHSSQALALLLDPASGQADAGRQQRFLFALKLQMARFSWLFGAAAEGQAVELVAASEPTLLLTSDGRVGVDVELRVAPGEAAATRMAWNFSCRDPSLYWVSEFMVPESPIRVTGCTRALASPAVKVADGPLAGSVQVEVRCPS